FCRLRFIEERHAMPMERLARFGERETPRRAVDEAHAELGLQRGDAAAELRCLQAQCFCRRRVRAEVDDLGEEIEVVEVLNRGHRQPQLFYSRQICIPFLLSAQGIIAQLLTCTRQAGAQLCPINVVNFWGSPLAQSQSPRPQAWS